MRRLAGLGFRVYDFGKSHTTITRAHFVLLSPENAAEIDAFTAQHLRRYVWVCL